MQEIIKTGKTVDEAVEAACKELGLSRDDVTVEILEMPQKKLFGSKPAEVKVSAIDDGFSVKTILTGEDKPQPKKENQPAPQAKKPEQKPFEQKAQPAQPKREEKKPEPMVLRSEDKGVEIAEGELTAPVKLAYDYLKELCTLMGAEKLTYKTMKTERGITIEADGEDASLIIGRRGDTMDALQYLCTLVCNRAGGDEEASKISLDIANYRSKREKTLIELAEREAAKVKKTRYSKALEPMNPYERRIVHSAIQEIEGVKSESVGFEPNRRVVISLISGGRTRDGRGHDSHGGNRNGGGRNFGDKPRFEKRDGERPRYEKREGDARPQSSGKPADNRAPQGEFTALYKKIEF